MYWYQSESLFAFCQKLEATSKLRLSESDPSDLFHYIPPLQQKEGHSETLLNTCIAHSNSADLLLSNNASDWLSGDFDSTNQ